MARKKNRDTFGQELNTAEQEVYQTFRALMDALVAADTKKLAGLIDRDIRMVGMNGRPQNLEEFLAEVSEGLRDYTSIDLLKVQVLVELPKSREEDARDELEGPLDEENGIVEEVSEENTEEEPLPEEIGDGSYATLTCISRQRAKLYGMSGTFHRHIVARFARRSSRWIYIGE